MPFDFDEGANGGASGPFLSWTARGTNDGDIPARSFYVRDKDAGKTDVTAKMKKGVVFDHETLQTGWCWSTGQAGMAPEWKWNASVARFEPQPEEKGGQRWKKGFQVRIALRKDETALWQQDGFGAFQSLAGIARLIKTQTEANASKVPLVKMTGARKDETGKTATWVAEFEIVKWVERPECLKATAAATAGDDDGFGSDAPAAPAPAPVGDDEF